MSTNLSFQTWKSWSSTFFKSLEFLSLTQLTKDLQLSKSRSKPNKKT